MIPTHLVVLLRKRLVEQLTAARADGLFLFQKSNLLGFCGLPLGPSDRLVCGLLNREGRAAVILPAFEAELAGACTKVDCIAAWEEHEDPFAAVANTARVMGLDAGRILLDGHTWLQTHAALKTALPKATLIADGCVVEAARIIKHASEIETIRLACEETAKTYAFVAGRIRSGVAEIDVAEETAQHLRRSGVQLCGLLLQTGQTASVPHAPAGARLIREGDPVVVDCVCTKHGYHGDLTRTLVVGEPDEALRAVYRVVRDAQQAAIGVIRPGVSCEKVDAAARSVIERAGFDRYFTHRLGHGIGLDGHEPPYLRRGNRQKLEPGMCVTVEPGVYLPGRFGVRIEDVVAVTSTGCEILSEGLATDISPGVEGTPVAD